MDDKQTEAEKSFWTYWKTRWPHTTDNEKNYHCLLIFKKQKLLLLPVLIIIHPIKKSKN